MNSPTPSRLENETISVSPIEPFISRTIFRTLPIDVQMDYARFYSLPNNESLTTDDICGALFRETEWTPALDIEAHVRHVTANEVFVARETMDLVDWVVKHRVKDPPGPLAEEKELDGADDEMETGWTHDVSTERAPRSTLGRMAEHLQKAQSRIKAAIEASRESVREASTDVFILRGRLEEENTYQDAVLKRITSTGGIHSVQGTQKHHGVSSRAAKSLISKTTSGTLQKAPKLPQISLPFHTLHLDGNQGVYESNVNSVPPTSSPSSGTKRPLDVEAEATSNIDNMSPSHRHKRPRIEGCVQPNHTISPVQDIPIPQTILNYPSDDHQDEEDTSYSDSNGTERDFIDDPYSFYGPHGETPLARELPRAHRSCSEEDDDWDGSDCAQSFRWSATESDSDCFSDPDYRPIADWDLEDVLELNNHGVCGDIFPLYKFRYMDELLDCGGALSDAGISSDDSEHGYLDEGMLQRSVLTSYDRKTLGALLNDPFQRYRCKSWFSRRKLNDETLAKLKAESIVERRKMRWHVVRASAHRGLPSWVALDVDERLSNILASDQSHFYVDAKEWMHFEEPLPDIFSPYVNSRPLVT